MARLRVTFETDRYLVEAARTRPPIGHESLIPTSMGGARPGLLALIDDVDEFQDAHRLGLTEDEAADLAGRELADYRAERRGRSPSTFR